MDEIVGAGEKKNAESRGSLLHEARFVAFVLLFVLSFMQFGLLMDWFRMVVQCVAGKRDEKWKTGRRAGFRSKSVKQE